MPSPRNVPAARPVFAEADRAAIAELVNRSLASGSLTLGPLTESFEEGFANRHQVAHAVAVSSGTAALEIILRSLSVEGRKVVVPANTFFATAAAVLHAGGIPCFADVDPRTFALSAETLDAALDDDCAAVVAVHIGGFLGPDIEAISELCRRRGVPLVEDAAHAHGSAWRSQPAGTFGVAAAFSFYPTKVMTSGEGGMIVTADANLAADARIYRDQGKSGFVGGDHVRLGYAWRMSELHAAVGLVQLARLDEFIAVRQRMARHYDEALRNIAGVTALEPAADAHPNYYKYIATLDDGVDRAELKRRLRVDHGVAMSGEVYAEPLHRQPVFAGIPHRPLPAAEDVCARQVCLPIHSDMTDDEAAHVSSAIAEVFDDLTAVPDRVME